MTQLGQHSKNLKEFNSLFLSLDAQAQDQALLMLRTLEFAQSAPLSGTDVKAVKGE